MRAARELKMFGAAPINNLGRRAIIECWLFHPFITEDVGMAGHRAGSINVFWRSLADNWRKRVIDLIPRNAVCAEIGVWQGDFSARMTAAG